MISAISENYRRINIFRFIVKKAIDDIFNPRASPRYNHTSLALRTVGAKETETEGVGRWVDAAANSGERTRTPATGRASSRERREGARVVEELTNTPNHGETRTPKELSAST